MKKETRIKKINEELDFIEKDLSAMRNMDDYTMEGRIEKAIQEKAKLSNELEDLEFDLRHETQFNGMTEKEVLEYLKENAEEAGKEEEFFLIPERMKEYILKHGGDRIRMKFDGASIEFEKGIDENEPVYPLPIG